MGSERRDLVNVLAQEVVTWAPGPCGAGGVVPEPGLTVLERHDNVGTGARRMHPSLDKMTYSARYGAFIAALDTLSAEGRRGKHATPSSRPVVWPKPDAAEWPQ